MENFINFEMLEKSENQLKRRIFTEIQLNVLKKKLKKETLDSSEKTYYYKFIKPKIKAIFSLLEISDYVIRGKEHMFAERITKATKIIKKLARKHKKKKILVSGSFLHTKNYQDIDLFVFTKYNKEDYRKGKIHVNFLPEDSLSTIFFSSLSKISISNFAYKSLNNFEIELSAIFHTYELLINLVLNNEPFEKELRTFFLHTEYVSKGVILNSKQLYELKKNIQNRNIFGILSNTLINTLMFYQNKNHLRKTIQRQIRDYRNLSKDYCNAKNIRIYLKTYQKALKNAT